MVSISHRFAALFVDSVADLLIDHLTLLLGDGLGHSLAFLLLFALAVFLVHNVAPENANIFIIKYKLFVCLFPDLWSMTVLQS